MLSAMSVVLQPLEVREDVPARATKVDHIGIYLEGAISETVSRFF